MIFGNSNNSSMTHVKKHNLYNVCQSAPQKLHIVFSSGIIACLLLLFSDFLQSAELQFDFKNNFSCAHAIYIAEEVLNYFNKQHT